MNGLLRFITLQTALDFIGCADNFSRLVQDTDKNVVIVFKTFFFQVRLIIHVLAYRRIPV